MFIQNYSIPSTRYLNSQFRLSVCELEMRIASLAQKSDNTFGRYCIGLVALVKYWAHWPSSLLTVPWFQMIELIFPILDSRVLLPTFSTNCLDGSYFAQMRWSSFAQNTTPISCSLLSRHNPLSGICTYTKHPQPHPKTPFFLAWTWMWAKWATVWAIWTPTGQKCLKSGENFSRSGQKENVYWF